MGVGWAPGDWGWRIGEDVGAVGEKGAGGGAVSGCRRGNEAGGGGARCTKSAEGERYLVRRSVEHWSGAAEETKWAGYQSGCGVFL